MVYAEIDYQWQPCEKLFKAIGTSRLPRIALIIDKLPKELTSRY
jgi:hypothetical protein